MIWAAIFSLLLFSFVFSGIEAGVLSVSRVRLRHRIDAGDAAAARLERLLHDPAGVLITVLIVTNLMNISAIILGTQAIVTRIGLIGYPIALAFCLPLYLLALEMLPKSIFRRFPYRALAALSEPLRLANLILSPVVRAGQEISRQLLRRNHAQRQAFLERDDFKFLTAESERIGNLTKVQRELIHNLVDFQSLAAKDLMLPLARAQTVARDASLRSVIDLSKKLGVDKLAVSSMDGSIVGVVSAFEILVDHSAERKLGSYIRRILTITENEPAHAILAKMRAARAEVALVTTQDTKPCGVISLNDLMRRVARSR